MQSSAVQHHRLRCQKLIISTSLNNLWFSSLAVSLTCRCVPCILNQIRLREDQSRPISLVHPCGCISKEQPWISEANKRGHYSIALLGPAIYSCETCKHRLVCAQAIGATLCSPHYRIMVNFHHWSLTSKMGFFSPPEQTNCWITRAATQFVSPGALVPIYQTKSFLSIGLAS